MTGEKGGSQQRPHLHLILGEVDDRQSLPDNLPIILVVDGGDFGALALEDGQSWVLAVALGSLDGTRPAWPLLTFTRYR